MKASDSLKLFCADPYTGWVPREKQQDELRKIAARVEEVEQRAEELEHALEDARAGLEQWHDRAVMLPTDAEGVPIRVGDRIEYNTGGRDTVRFLTLNRDGWMVNERGWKAETMHHVHPDSWERIIEDARVCLMSDYKTEATPTMRWKSELAELVERCKRLAGEDA